MQPWEVIPGVQYGIQRLFAGTVGLKPTWGQVSRYGVLDLAQSLDHVGPLTRTAIDAGLVMQVISGEDSNDPTSLLAPVPNLLDSVNKGIKDLKIGWDVNIVLKI